MPLPRRLSLASLSREPLASFPLDGCGQAGVTSPLDPDDGKPIIRLADILPESIQFAMDELGFRLGPKLSLLAYKTWRLRAPSGSLATTSLKGLSSMLICRLCSLAHRGCVCQPVRQTFLYPQASPGYACIVYTCPCISQTAKVLRVGSTMYCMWLHVYVQSSRCYSLDLFPAVRRDIELVIPLFLSMWLQGWTRRIALMLEHFVVRDSVPPKPFNQYSRVLVLHPPPTRCTAYGMVFGLAAMVRRARDLAICWYGGRDLR